MLEVSGTFQGTYYNDLRVLIPIFIKEFYQKQGSYDRIRKYRSYEFREVVLIELPTSEKSVFHYVKHTWQYNASYGWALEYRTFLRTLPSRI